MSFNDKQITILLMAQKPTKSENRGQRMDVANDPNKGMVTIKFDAPVTFMALYPEHARQLAKDLIENAAQIERKKMQ
jgi:hypothetical protein